MKTGHNIGDEIYTVVRCIDAGHNGSVYEVLDTSGKKWAIKSTGWWYYQADVLPMTAKNKSELFCALDSSGEDLAICDDSVKFRYRSISRKSFDHVFEKLGIVKQDEFNDCPEVTYRTAFLPCTINPIRLSKNTFRMELTGSSLADTVLVEIDAVVLNNLTRTLVVAMTAAHVSGVCIPDIKPGNICLHDASPTGWVVVDVDDLSNSYEGAEWATYQLSGIGNDGTKQMLANAALLLSGTSRYVTWKEICAYFSHHQRNKADMKTMRDWFTHPALYRYVDSLLRNEPVYDSLHILREVDWTDII